ncbi:four helix bundle protein [Candidatus Kaiserbacteria bacterium]|nr:four helix bundle protein [Candidatus Kaiserbacteria bacterium]
MNREQKNLEGSHSYRKLLVWQKAVELSLGVYTLTKKFPKDELFALTSQMRRAGVSVAANIAEGYGRNTPKEFANFLRISHGSLTELETLLTIAKELSYCTEKDCSTIEMQLDETGRMLYALRAKLR